MAGGPDWKTLGAEVRLLIHHCPTSAPGDLDYVIQGKCFSSGRFPRQSPRIVSHTYLGLWTNLLVLQIVPWTSISIKGHYGVAGEGGIQVMQFLGPMDMLNSEAEGGN